MSRPKSPISRADRLRWLLEFYKHMGVSNRDLSWQCGLKETHLGQLVTTLEETPGAVELATMDKVAARTGIPISWLIDGGDELPAPRPLKPTTPAERGTMKKKRDSGAFTSVPLKAVRGRGTYGVG